MAPSIDKYECNIPHCFIQNEYLFYLTILVSGHNCRYNMWTQIVLGPRQSNRSLSANICTGFRDAKPSIDCSCCVYSCKTSLVFHFLYTGSDFFQLQSNFFLNIFAFPNVFTSYLTTRRIPDKFDAPIYIIWNLQRTNFIFVELLLIYHTVNIGR